MVAPLGVGAHVLHWQGTAELPEAGHFAQDITYHITVLPELSKALP
jgi:hypothetical protein